MPTRLPQCAETTAICHSKWHRVMPASPSDCQTSSWTRTALLLPMLLIWWLEILKAEEGKKNQKLTSNSASHTCGWLRLKMFFTLGNTSCLHNEKYSMVCVRRDPSVQDITEARWSENVKTWTNTEKLTGISKSLGEKSFNKEECQVRSHFSKKTRGHCWPRVMVQMNRAQNA